MTDPLLDAKLRAYLDEQEQARAEGNTIANLRLEVHQMQLDVNELAAEQRLQRLRLDRHGRDIRALKQHVFSRDPHDDIDTGVHQVEDLKRHLAAKESELRDQRDSVWWRRQKWQWAMAAIGAVLLAALGGLASVIWFLVTRGGGK